MSLQKKALTEPLRAETPMKVLCVREVTHSIRQLGVFGKDEDAQTHTQTLLSY